VDLRAVNIGKSDPDKILADPAIMVLNLNVEGVTINRLHHPAISFVGGCGS
jgi:hypothetical protein